MTEHPSRRWKITPEGDHGKRVQCVWCHADALVVSGRGTEITRWKYGHVCQVVLHG